VIRYFAIAKSIVITSGAPGQNDAGVKAAA
jgi:hypothetical protein